MESIVSIRIRNARIQHLLSLQQVADSVGVSKQMISKYEQGKVIPNSQKLISLGKLFNKKIDYFFSEPEIKLGEINFRKKNKFSKKKVDALKEEIRVQIENYLFVENICSLNTVFKNPIANRLINNKHDVVNAVHYIREVWQIGNDTIHNIIELLEDNEVKVIEVNDDTMQFDGLATKIDNKYYVVVINKNMPIERKRFTLLHELGHLLLNLNNIEEKDVEKYCNWFASEMLLSTENIMIEFGNKRKSITVEELKNVQSKYGISIKAIVYILSEVEIISQEKVVSFYKNVNAKPSLKNEIDSSRFNGNETSIRFENLVYRALSEEIISISKASTLLNTSLEHLRQNLLAINIC
ncbi:MAG: XRE family transcriptional regulator [Chitinophagaceae bacterium]|nr:XRE family transcriptional regulator [Chitinophagaceae bacterium]